MNELLLKEKSLSQRLSARIELEGYAGVGSYSVYKVGGSADVGGEYAYDIEFISDSEIEINELNDTKAKLSIKDENELFVKKQVSGLIYEAKEFGSIAKKRLYKIRLVSPLFYLGLNKRYEVFMDQSVPSIVQTLISRYASLLNLEIDINKVDPKAYPIRHYTTQYAQSDLEFIKMLLQEEGLVLLLDESSDDPFSVTLCQLNEHAPLLEKKIECSYNKQKSFLPSNQLQDHYDKNRPSQDMQVSNDHQLQESSFEDNGATKQLRQSLKKERLRDRLELLENSFQKDLNRYTLLDSQREYSNALIITGKTKDLRAKEGVGTQLYNPKIDKHHEVIITSVKYSGYFPNALDEHIEDSTQNSTQYEVKFKAISKEMIYRPKITIDKPRIDGVQTAIVSCGESDTSKDANEIDVNEEGEIRVIFHFDKNRPTSCYIPLSTIFSGDNYGAQFLPRVNSEVIVSFINGDIDKPVIIGSLHNGENRHPYNLPKDKTKSFIKTYSTPQYEDKEGYNELLFEDKAGDERLALRAQKDYELHTLNDANIHIQHDKKTIIDNNEEYTVAKNYTQTIGEDHTTKIAGNAIKVVEKEQITTINEDRETHLNKNDTTITKEDKKEIIEKDLIQRIKGYVTDYYEKDVKEKYLESLYSDVTKELGIRVQEAFHLQANSIKENASGTIELEAPSGISLKCGGNVLTVDGSGIHLKASTVDTTSSNGGVSAKDVIIPEIEKPLYNKLRVIQVQASVTKQSEITQELTYTAIVEKYEDGAWMQTTDLTPTQKMQLQWFFIKNNDQNDKDIVTDNPTDDTIQIDGLTMNVTLDEDNIHKYGHVHCYVSDAQSEGYVFSELKRKLEVIEIAESYQTQEMGECIAMLNVDDPMPEEIAQICWKVNGKEKGEYKGKETITHNLKEEKTYEIHFDSYIQNSSDEAAQALLVYDEDEKQLVQLRFENE